MAPFRYHVVVCTQQKPENVKCCATLGSLNLVDSLQAELRRQGAADDVLVSSSGCMGACEFGPVMVVYPEGVWYGGLKAGDAAEIVTSHLKAGRPVERLRVTDMDALRHEILEHRKDFAAKTAARDKGGVLPDEIQNMMHNYMSSRTLMTAAELDVFTAVGDGASPAEVASKCGTDVRATEMLLNALVALGLLEKRDGRFASKPMSARFLTEGSPDNARSLVLHRARAWDRWSQLSDCMRGAPVERKGHGQKEPQQFIAAMDRNARDRAMMVTRAIGPVPKRMLDLAGGSGAYALALARANPELKAEVLDLPGIVPITQEYIRKAGMGSRVSARAGDLKSDRFGQDYDLILLSMVVHEFSPEQNRDLLRRACAALAANGRLVVQDYILEADKTAPRAATLFSLHTLVSHESSAAYSEPEYESWMKEAGFREVKRVRLPGPINLMVAAK